MRILNALKLVDSPLRISFGFILSLSVNHLQHISYTKYYLRCLHAPFDLCVFGDSNHRSCALFRKPEKWSYLKPLSHVGLKASTYRADYWFDQRGIFLALRFPPVAPWWSCRTLLYVYFEFQITRRRYVDDTATHSRSDFPAPLTFCFATSNMVTSSSTTYTCSIYPPAYLTPSHLYRFRVTLHAFGIVPCPTTPRHIVAWVFKHLIN